jgi:hypothetical protein
VPGAPAEGQDSMSQNAVRPGDYVHSVGVVQPFLSLPTILCSSARRRAAPTGNLTSATGYARAPFVAPAHPQLIVLITPLRGLPSANPAPPQIRANRSHQAQLATRSIVPDSWTSPEATLRSTPGYELCHTSSRLAVRKSRTTTNPRQPEPPG